MEVSKHAHKIATKHRHSIKLINIQYYTSYLAVILISILIIDHLHRAEGRRL